MSNSAHNTTKETIQVILGKCEALDHRSAKESVQTGTKNKNVGIGVMKRNGR